MPRVIFEVKGRDELGSLEGASISERSHILTLPLTLKTKKKKVKIHFEFWKVKF